MTIGSGALEKPVVNSTKKDKVGKSLHITLAGEGKKLKGTRFNLDDPTVELPAEIMEKWIDTCLEKDRDILSDNAHHKLTKND